MEKAEVLHKLEEKCLDFKLGEEQKEVLLQVFQCIDTKLPLITSIVGSAGTGKSTIAKIIIGYLDSEKRKYLLASPTHKAKSVLAKYTNKPVTTLHKLLNLSAVVDILDLNFSNLKFDYNKGDCDIPRDGVLIIDECSMISKDLYKLITERAAEMNCMVIFIGDLQQLRPVKESSVSKSFTDSYPFELTKIYRQEGDNPILDLLDDLRIGPVYNFPEINSEKGQLVKYPKWKDLIQANALLFKRAIASKDPDYVKLLAYTNVRVEAFNQVIRKVIFKEPREYNVGDLLMGYDTTRATYPNPSTITNSADYRVEKAKSASRYISGILCRGWELKLYSFEDDVNFNIFMLSRDNPVPVFEDIARTIEQIRLQAINTNKSLNKGLYAKRWKLYYEILNSFLTPVDLKLGNRVIRKKTLDFGYCITVHKSQGSSFEHLLVDMENIMKCKDIEELQQLQYVALSRTRKNIHMLI